MTRRIARRLRSLAYGTLCRRDGTDGWKPHRDRFLASTALSVQLVEESARDRLRQVLVHAGRSSPYYRDLWKRIGYRPEQEFGPQALAGLPFLTKDDIREQKATLVSERVPADLLDLSYTGGTTGTQTAFYLDHACAVARLGRQWGMFELCGYVPGMRRALLWGVHDELPSPSVRGSVKARFRRYASGDETMCCTIMHASDLAAYHARLSRFRPEVIYGYPNGLVELARFVEDRDLQPIRVDRVFTTAERLSSGVRQYLGRAFGGEVFSLYCAREHGCIGFECPKHRGFHVDTDSVWIEIVKNGRSVERGEEGEIVITDLLNYGMPFIRNRTGDIGALATEPCDCGLPWPVLKALDGRATDIVFRPDGGRVPGLMLTDLLTDLPGVRYQQFVQHRVDVLEVLLVVSGDFPEAARLEVVRQVRTIMGNAIDVHVRVVDSIARNPVSGKIREVIGMSPTSQRTESATTH